MSKSDIVDPARVMRFEDWCERKGISVPTGKRILRSGKGPKVVRLSARRIGVTYGDDAAWTEARTGEWEDMKCPARKRRVQ
jgi:hypothetical protein